MTKRKSGKTGPQVKGSPSKPTSTSSSTTLDQANKDHHDTSVTMITSNENAQLGRADIKGKSVDAATLEPSLRSHKAGPEVSTAFSGNDTQTYQSRNEDSSIQQNSNESSGQGAATKHVVPIRAQYKDQRPGEQRAGLRRYDQSDVDTERSPLLRMGTRNGGGYSSSGDSTHGGADGDQQPTTWTEWALKNGLHPRKWNRQTYIKAGLLATLLILIVLSFTVFRIQDHIKDVLKYIDQHKRIGALLFILSYTVACTLFLPGSLFTVGAGFLFKPFPLALLIVLLGDVVASAWAFIFGRYVFHEWVKSTMSKHPKFNALDEVIKDDGWKIVVMLRLTPIPFNLITYFFSITSIRLWTVVWATCIGVLPGSCIGIWIGSLLKGLSGIDHPDLETKNLVVIAMNFVFVICCILTLSIFGKRSLRNALKRLEQHQALTNVPEVEVVVEGVATVIHELEDTTDVPPSLRSSIIEQLATEDADPNYYRGDLEAARQRHSGSSQASERNREAGESSSTPNTTLDNHRNHIGKSGVPHKVHSHSLSEANLSSSGFTRGEKLTFMGIIFLAVLNVCVCVPLYIHFS
ncbi:MAG: snare associated Golgi protein-domain-containing protein [Benniella sp.]|nr:MAG: snare associated Golgi protein-domain-containing protein [Benniella sp.]